MGAVNGAVLLMVGALLVALFYGLRATPRARRDLIVLNCPGGCDADGCDQRGILLAHTTNGTIRVCHDCYTEGAALGAWTA